MQTSWDRNIVSILCITNIDYRAMFAEFTEVYNGSALLFIDWDYATGSMRQTNTVRGSSLGFQHHHISSWDSSFATIKMEYFPWFPCIFVSKTFPLLPLTIPSMQLAQPGPCFRRWWTAWEPKDQKQKLNLPFETRKIDLPGIWVNIWEGLTSSFNFKELENWIPPMPLPRKIP